MTGTSGIDYLYAKEGNDTLRGLGAFDDLRVADLATTASTEGGATTSTTSTTTAGE